MFSTCAVVLTAQFAHELARQALESFHQSEMLTQESEGLNKFTLSRLGIRVTPAECTEILVHYHHHHHHQSLNCEGRWGTTDDFATSFLHFSLFSTALWDLPNSRPVHSLMLSSHLFLCPPCLLPPFTVPCKMVLARRDERET